MFWVSNLLEIKKSLVYFWVVKDEKYGYLFCITKQNNNMYVMQIKTIACEMEIIIYKLQLEIELVSI